LSGESLLTLKQAAARLGVSYQFLWRCCKRGEFPVVKLSDRCIRIRESDLVVYVNAHRLASAIIEQTASKRAERDAKRRASGVFLTTKDLEPPAV